MLELIRFHPRNQFQLQKLVENDCKIMQIRILIHSCSPVPLDKEEFEDDNERNGWIFSLYINFGSRIQLKFILEGIHLMVSSSLDHRFLWID